MLFRSSIGTIGTMASYGDRGGGIRTHISQSGNSGVLVRLNYAPAFPAFAFNGGPGGIRTRVDRAISMVFQAITLVRSSHRPPQMRRERIIRSLVIALG